MSRLDTRRVELEQQIGIKQSQLEETTKRADTESARATAQGNAADDLWDLYKTAADLVEQRSASDIDCSQPRSTGDIFFLFDLSQLPLAATDHLKRVADCYSLYRQSARIEVDGQTTDYAIGDTVLIKKSSIPGTAEYAIAIGDRRANAVAAGLRALGVPADRIRTVSDGEERPKYNNRDKKAGLLNNRVDITVVIEQ